MNNEEMVGAKMPDGSLICIVGQLKFSVEALREKMDVYTDISKEHRTKIEATLKSLDYRVRSIEDTILMARVSWKTLIWIGTVVTGIMTAIAWVMSYFHTTITRYFHD